MNYEASSTRKSVSIWHISSILGGAERSFLDSFPILMEITAIHVPESGYFVNELLNFVDIKKIVITKYPESIYKLSRSNGKKNIYFILRAFFTLIQFVFQINKIIAAEKPSIIYSYGIKNHFLLTPVAVFQKIPIVWHLQDYWPNNIFSNIFLRVAIKFNVSIVANSIDVGKKLKLNTSEQKKLKIIYNSVDSNTFQSAKKNHSKIVIGFIGMLVPWKGVHIFIEAIHILEKSLSKELWNKLEFWIVGGMPYKTAQGNDHYPDKCFSNIPNNVIIKGLVSNVNEIYQQLDILCHTSIHPEPFGRVIIEAMSSGVIPIVSNDGGPKEIISDQVDGYLFQPRNAQDLALKIKKALTLSDEEKNKIISNARKKVIDRFDKRIFHSEVNEYLKVKSS